SKNSVGSCRPAHAISFCTGSSYTSRSFARHFATRYSEMGEMSLLVFSPALLFAKLRDMRGVMFTVPLVEEQQPINGALAVFGVNESPCEMFGLQRAPQPVPAGVYRIQQRL